MDPDHEALFAKRSAMAQPVAVERDEMREAALKLQSLGYAVELLVHGTKKAMFRAWNERPPLDRASLSAQLRRKDCNLGVRLKESGLLVVDKDASSMDAWNLIRRYGIHKTPAQIETKRGVHYYLRTEPSERKSVIGLNGLPLDVKVSGYVVAPPSHVEGWTYRVREGKELLPVQDLPEVPEGFLELLDRKEVKEPPKYVSLPEEPKLSRMRAYISKIHAVSGQGGDRKTFIVACRVVEAVQNFEAAMAEILAWNETNALPPWEARALEHKIRSAMTRVFHK